MSLLNLTESDITFPGHTVAANVSDIDVDNIQSLDSHLQSQSRTVNTESPIVGAASVGESQNGSSNIEFHVSNESLSDGEQSELLEFLKRNEDVSQHLFKIWGKQISTNTVLKQTQMHCLFIFLFIDKLPILGMKLRN